MASNTIKTRVQLKCDTEANWNKSVLVADGGEKESGTSFVPLKGEVIIYTADDTHPFSRFKVGDAQTNVVQLPFIDAHSINNIIFEESSNDFPPIGNVNMLYTEVSTLTTYKWEQGNYVKLYQFQKQSVTSVTGWDAGTMTELTVSNDGILEVVNGTAPSLNTTNIDVLTGIIGGA